MKKEHSIEVRNLTRTFGAKQNKVTAVDQVNLSIPEGSVLCLVGESGCGKTTTGKMVAGLLKPSGGEVLYQGQSIWTEKGRKAPGFKKFRLDGRWCINRLDKNR